jgi:hypothetical protein
MRHHCGPVYTGTSELHSVPTPLALFFFLLIITPRTFVEDLPQLPVLLIISTFNFRELKCFELGVANTSRTGRRGAAALPKLRA